MMRRLLRDLLVAGYFALAPSQAESIWVYLDSRPVAVLPIGEPVIPLVARLGR